MSINHLFDVNVSSTQPIRKPKPSTSEMRLKVKSELEQLYIKKPKSSRYTCKIYKKFKIIIDDATKFLNSSKPTKKERVYCFINNVTELVICPECKVNKVKFHTFSSGYSKYCSRKCSGNSSETNEKFKTTMNKKYPDCSKQYTHLSISEMRLKIRLEVKKLKINTPKSNHTVRRVYMKYKNIIDENTFFFLCNNVTVAERVYCFINNINGLIICPECKTNTVNFQEFNTGYSKCCSRKCSANSSEKKEKIKITNRKIYGADSPMQNKEILEKSQKNSYQIKIYTFPSGKNVNVQGNEPFALDILLETYNEKQIKTNVNDIPIISYYIDGTKHVYFCDIFLPHLNKFIEVKSQYTFNYKPEWEVINLLKQQSCKDLGYEHEIWIIDETIGQVTNIM